MSLRSCSLAIREQCHTAYFFLLRDTRVFPLPLSPFEYYYWCDDRVEYPIAFPIDMHFSGTLERAALETAVADLRVRHPMLSATIDTSGRWPVWVAAKASPGIDWGDETTPIRDSRGPYMDLRTEPGLRACVREGADRTRVHLQFHHACCDGLAAVDLAEELTVRYARRIGVLEKPARTVDAAQLATRGQFLDEDVPRSGGPLVFLRDAAVTGSLFSKLILRHPGLLAGRATANGCTDLQRETDDLEFVTRFLSDEQTKRLRKAARRSGASLNDVLLRDMFLTVVRWNADCSSTKNDWLRFLVPVNLRTRSDRTMPATNRISFAFVSRRAADCRRDDAMLKAIHEDVQRIRDQRRGLYFLGGLKLAARIKDAIPWVLSRRKSFATLVISNLGRLFTRSPLPRQEGKVVCGSAVLESVTGVPPIRPLTHAAMAIGYYGHEMALALRCDPALFSPEDTRAFLDAYVAQLEETADVAADLPGVSNPGVP